MNGNEQSHQPDLIPPPVVAFRTADEKDEEEVRHHSEKPNRPEVSADQLGEAVALTKTSHPELANQFASFDVEGAKKAFVGLSEMIQEKAEASAVAYKSAEDTWKELTPPLSQMQALLSQRGAMREAVLREAGLPTWTEWFETFKRELGLKLSLRAVQKKLARFRGNGDAGEDSRAQHRGASAKPNAETALYKQGYRAGRAEIQVQLNAASERQSALAARVAELEKENERLQGVAQQVQGSEGKGGGKLRGRVEKLEVISNLAVKAFEIVNGELGNRLMASADGKSVVDIAKKVLALMGKLTVC